MSALTIHRKARSKPGVNHEVILSGMLYTLPDARDQCWLKRNSGNTHILPKSWSLQVARLPSLSWSHSPCAFQYIPSGSSIDT